VETKPKNIAVTDEDTPEYPRIVGKIDLSEHKGYENIPKTGFTSIKEEINNERVTISQRTRALITLSIFAVVQLLEGMEQIFQNMTIHQIDNLGATDLNPPARLYFKLKKVWHDTHIERKGEPSVISLELNRKEMRHLRHWLETRMAHCEKQRDARDPNFNPDTYISQKLLLIEIREWLLGEYVD